MATELQQSGLQEDINRQPTAGEMQLAVTHLNFQPSADMPERLRKALPDAEDLKGLLSGGNIN